MSLSEHVEDELEEMVVGAEREELMASGPRGGNSGRSRRLTTGIRASQGQSKC